MKNSEQQLLNNLYGFMKQRPVSCILEQEREWEELLSMSFAHKILPMIYDSMGKSDMLASIPLKYQAIWRSATWSDVAQQVRKTELFLDVYRQVQKAGIKCLVLKGMICRDLYVNPDARISGDEDLYIRKEDYRAFHKICEENGFCNLGNSEVEPAFFHEESGLKLEVHFELFNGQSESCGDLNKPFEHSLDHAIEIEIQKTKLWTMNETDHMLYLILHSFKHFIHSGFGVRQVCDIITYAEHYGDKIEWKYIFRELCKVKADIFLVNLFDIGKEYLGFSYGKAKLPRKLIENYADEIDSGALLKDLLAAGVYGSSSASRVHSSLITLNAVASSRQKRGIQGSIRRTIFPVSKEMESIYPYLKHNRLLLPAAWLQRILKYGKELADNKVGSRNSAWESISIGNQRIELMKKYKIIAK